ncbi:hypothetical protein SAY86_017685 [Trapa natans]|uniref:Uncharacterized protein n=1 Tax=Trapa natans TaxID=22666 RepID=A0AAN7R7M9_TRANT|nr:hypothetical protein SAY86_017685 [Trapa natans]
MVYSRLWSKINNFSADTHTLSLSISNHLPLGLLSLSSLPLSIEFYTCRRWREGQKTMKRAWKVSRCYIGARAMLFHSFLELLFLYPLLHLVPFVSAILLEEELKRASQKLKKAVGKHGEFQGSEESLDRMEKVGETTFEVR